MMEIDGEEWLFYKAFPINVAFIRGTTADLAGNITMEREALTLDNLAHRHGGAATRGGFVIAQVERIAARGRAQSARRWWSPACWSIASCVAEPENHQQTYGTAYSPAFAGEIARAARHARAAAARRAQGHRAALRVRAADGRRRQPRHRHARGRRRRRQRGEASLDLRDADRRARRHRRRAAGRARLRRGGQHRGRHPPEPAVRLLRRRRPRHGLPRHGAGRRARATSTSAASARGWPAPAASSTSARTRASVVFAGTFTAGGLEVAVEDGELRIVREGTQPQVRRRGRADHLQRRLRRRDAGSRCSTSPSAASSGARRRAWS